MMQWLSRHLLESRARAPFPRPIQCVRTIQVADLTAHPVGRVSGPEDQTRSLDRGGCGGGGDTRRGCGGRRRSMRLRYRQSGGRERSFRSRRSRDSQARDHVRRFGWRHCSTGAAARRLFPKGYAGRRVGRGADVSSHQSSARSPSCCRAAERGLIHEDLAALFKLHFESLP
jgi:hypothetical protein